MDTIGLGPHAWDTAAHRAVLHAAFDRVALACECGARKQAARLLAELKRLSSQARERQARVEAGTAADSGRKS